MIRASLFFASWLMAAVAICGCGHSPAVQRSVIVNNTGVQQVFRRGDVAQADAAVRTTSNTPIYASGAVPGGDEDTFCKTGLSANDLSPSGAFVPSNSLLHVILTPIQKSQEDGTATSSGAFNVVTDDGYQGWICGGTSVWARPSTTR